MSRRAWAIVAVAIVGLTVAPGGATQYRATTTGVRLDVLALDGTTPRAGLTTDHFELRDNGVLQELESVAISDRLTMVGFGHVVRLLATPDGTVQPERLPTGGSTSLHDAVFGSLLQAEDDPRPALMILLTDGVDSASWLTEAQVLDAASKADVVVYPVVVD